MKGKTSQADFMASTLTRLLHVLRYDRNYTVKQIASLAHCSESLVYTWYDAQAPALPQGVHLLGLMMSLADRGEMLFLDAVTPAGMHIASDDEMISANGCTRDEEQTLVIANAGLVMAGRAKDADGIAEVRRQLRATEQALAGEEALLRGRTQTTALA